MGMLPHPDPEGFRQGGGITKDLPNHFARKPLSETVSYL